jgi:hypothetical protein
VVAKCEPQAAQELIGFTQHSELRQLPHQPARRAQAGFDLAVRQEHGLFVA